MILIRMLYRIEVLATGQSGLGVNMTRFFCGLLQLLTFSLVVFFFSDQILPANLKNQNSVLTYLVYTVQSSPNQNLPNQMAVSLKIGIFRSQNLYSKS